MNPLYHLQVGSFIANARDYGLRERRMIMLASLAPDLDGVLIFNQGIWEQVHHTFSHNIFFVAGVSIAMALANKARRMEIFLVCLAAGALQLPLDSITNHPSWKQRFLWPISDFEFKLAALAQFEGLAFIQVKVVQTALMLAILAGTVYLYKRSGRTFIELLSAPLDRLLTDFITLPFKSRCAVCGRRAFYRESERGEPLCPHHAHVKKDLTIGRRREQDKG